jgi:hypothetical protein
MMRDFRPDAKRGTGFCKKSVNQNLAPQRFQREKSSFTLETQRR